MERTKSPGLRNSLASASLLLTLSFSQYISACSFTPAPNYPSTKKTATSSVSTEDSEAEDGSTSVTDGGRIVPTQGINYWGIQNTAGIIWNGILCYAGPNLEGLVKLFCHDGTTATARQVSNINSGASDLVSNLVSGSDGKLYFSALSGMYYEVFAFDGVTITQVSYGEFSAIDFLTELGGKLLISARASGASNHQISQAELGGQFSELSGQSSLNTRITDTFYFDTRATAVMPNGDRFLLLEDGSGPSVFRIQGSSLTKIISGSDIPMAITITTVGSTLLILDGNNLYRWTAAGGLTMYPPLDSGNGASFQDTGKMTHGFINTGSAAYFTMTDFNGTEAVYKATAGTLSVVFDDQNGGAMGGTEIQGLVPFGTEACFIANASDGPHAYCTTGGGTSVQQLETGGQKVGAVHLAVSGNSLYFDSSTSGGLYRFDGSSVTSVSSGIAVLTALIGSSSGVYFVAHDTGNSTYGLYMASGGTVTRLADTGPSSGTYEFTLYPGTHTAFGKAGDNGVFYLRHAPNNSQPLRLGAYVPGSGIVPVHDDLWSAAPSTREMKVIGGRLYFVASDDNGYQLFVYYGGVTTKISNSLAGNGFKALGESALYCEGNGKFYLHDANGSREVPGTADCGPLFEVDGSSGFYYVRLVSFLNRSLYYSDGVTSTQISNTNPTITGPSAVYSGMDLVGELVVLNGDAYFSAQKQYYSGLRKLYRSIQHQAATEVTGLLASNYNEDPTHLTTFNGEVYFSANSNLSNQKKLYKVGSTGSPQQISNTRPGGDDNPLNITSTSAGLIFTAADPIGRHEPWALSTSGIISSAGDLHPGASDGIQKITANSTGALISDGYKPYYWNGTTLTDLGMASGTDFFVADDVLYFYAYPTLPGTLELYRIGADGTPTQVSESTGSLYSEVTYTPGPYQTAANYGDLFCFVNFGTHIVCR